MELVENFLLTKFPPKILFCGDVREAQKIL